jgi:hypothetical protein
MRRGTSHDISSGGRIMNEMWNEKQKEFTHKISIFGALKNMIFK